LKSNKRFSIVLVSKSLSLWLQISAKRHNFTKMFASFFSHFQMNKLQLIQNSKEIPIFKSLREKWNKKYCEYNNKNTKQQQQYNCEQFALKSNRSVRTELIEISLKLYIKRHLFHFKKTNFAIIFIFFKSKKRPQEEELKLFDDRFEFFYSYE
jgi:hypothetical protein